MADSTCVRMCVHVGAGAGDAGRLGEAAGVDEVEDAAAPLDLADEAVARRAGDVFDDGAALADHAVEQRRLADVGPADEGDEGLAAGRRSSGLLSSRHLRSTTTTCAGRWKHLHAFAGTVICRVEDVNALVEAGGVDRGTHLTGAGVSARSVGSSPREAYVTTLVCKVALQTFARPMTWGATLTTHLARRRHDADAHGDAIAGGLQAGRHAQAHGAA